MATRLTKLRLREVSLVDNPANDVARVLLAKRDAPAPETGEVLIAKSWEDADQLDDEDFTKADDDALDDLEAELDAELDAELGGEDEAEQDDDEDDEDTGDDDGDADGDDTDTPADTEKSMKIEDVLKGLPAEARAVVEKAQKDAKDAMELAKSLQEQSEVARYTDIAKTMLGDGTAVKVDVFAGVLRKCSEAERTELAAICKAAAEARQTAKLFEELGVEADDSVGDVTKAESVIEARAAEIRKAAGGKLTAAQAYVQALNEQSDLYDAIVS